jgi:hypothetical protein
VKCVSLRVKNKYIYIFLCELIKQCKKLLFLLEEGKFHNVFDDKPAKRPIAKRKYQNIHLQLIYMTLQEGMIIKGI